VVSGVLRYHGNFAPKWEICQRGRYPHTKESVLGGFVVNEAYTIHGGYTVDVLSRAGVAGNKGWSVGGRLST
jgi:hypothetical protein